ncbi:MAG: 30S ribosome-binding factor RbfA [Clostridia bacterium]|nr:30S ribosome-binding factor RbfA [Oscillospiraceae bacterium]MBQ6797527.1 30S ribosome-binding factor RbfA [Clostridia bacterium]
MYRNERLNEDIMRELCAIIRTVKDPRVSPLISVVRVEVTNDLSYATCYISAFEGAAKTEESVKGLKSAAGYVRRELGNSLKLRHVPQLIFKADGSIEHSAHINKMLNDVRPEGGYSDDEPEE